MSLCAAERDTTITMNDEDATAEIWTAQRRVITKLERRQGVFPSGLLSQAECSEVQSAEGRLLG